MGIENFRNGVLFFPQKASLLTQRYEKKYGRDENAALPRCLMASKSLIFVTSPRLSPARLAAGMKLSVMRSVMSRPRISCKPSPAAIPMMMLRTRNGERREMAILAVVQNTNQRINQS